MVGERTESQSPREDAAPVGGRGQPGRGRGHAARLREERVGPLAGARLGARVEEEDQRVGAHPSVPQRVAQGEALADPLDDRVVVGVDRQLPEDHWIDVVARVDGDAARRQGEQPLALRSVPSAPRRRRLMSWKRGTVRILAVSLAAPRLHTEGDTAVFLEAPGRIADSLLSVAEALDDPVQPRQQDLAARVVEHQRMGGIVDVLGGAAEMDEAGTHPAEKIKMMIVMDNIAFMRTSL